MDLPPNYVSVSKRALIKLVKKMNKKHVGADNIFKMKDSDSVSAKDFMQYVDTTLGVNLKKREMHALIVL